LPRFLARHGRQRRAVELDKVAQGFQLARGVEASTSLAKLSYSSISIVPRGGGLADFLAHIRGLVGLNASGDVAGRQA